MTNRMRGTGRALLSGARKTVWSMLARFNGGDTAAPLGNPLPKRHAEFGFVRNVDTNNIGSISDNSLLVNGTPAANDGIVSADSAGTETGFARMLGLAAFLTVKARTTFSSSLRFGFHSAGLANASVDLGIGYSAQDTIDIRVGATAIFTHVGAPGEHRFVIVSRQGGSLLFLKDANTAGRYRLLYPLVATGGTPIFAKLRYGSNAMNMRFENFGVRQLVDSFAARFTPVFALTGTRPAGTVIFHPTNGVITFTAQTLPSSGTMRLRFREQDASNFWAIDFASTGALALIECIAGVEFTRQSAGAGSIVNGGVLLIKILNNTIRVAVNSTIVMTHAGATNFASAQMGTLSSLGTGGACNSIACYSILLFKSFIDLLFPTVAVGDVFRHNADGQITFFMGALPSSGTTIIEFRTKDSNNKWQITISSTGALVLQEVIAGSPSTIATVAGAVAANTWNHIMLSNQTITIYTSGVLRITHATAVNFKTETAGKLAALGTSSTVLQICSNEFPYPATVVNPTYEDDILIIRAAVTETFVHNANGYLMFSIGTLSTVGDMKIRFRIQDANNYWQLVLTTTGRLQLNEVVAGTPTQRADVAGFASNHWAHIICDGATIRVLSGAFGAEAQRFTYASATNFMTATGGQIESAGNQVFGDFYIFPLYTPNTVTQQFDNLEDR